MKTFSQFVFEARTAESDKAFFDRIKRQAAAAGDKFPELTAAQAAIESGYGTSQSGKNNVFGQKGKGTTRRTREVVNGRDVNIDAEFQDFDSEEDSTKNRVNKWSYKYGDAKDLESAARNLQLPRGSRIPGSDRTSHGVYATDPNYVSALTRIAREQGGSEKSSPSTTQASLKPTPSAKSTVAPKPIEKQVIQDKGGKGGTVSTNTAYKTKLGGIKATSTRGETGTQVIRAQLKAEKPSNSIASLFKPKAGSTEKAVLGGVKGTVKHNKDGTRTFTGIKPTPKPK